MTMKPEQFSAAGNQTTQAPGGEWGEQPMNVGSIERLVSILVGGIGLLLLSRRLFVYVTLALASAYLLFRGVTGRCALYARANINTREQEDFAAGLRETTTGAHRAAPADRIGAGEQAGDLDDGEIARWMERERAVDPVEQASWESFPASDPPGKA
ncbi:MAG: DUF2892 domain-containing protein [Caldilineaceae bacterium]